MLSFLPTPVFADETSITKIILEPSALRISLHPSEHYHASIQVRNIGTVDQTLRVYAEPYLVDDNYATIFGESNPYTQISRWIFFDSPTIHLPAGQSTAINFHIDVPADAPAGGQYAAIFVQIDDQSSTTAVNLNHRVGTLLYSTISGATNQSGYISYTHAPFFNLDTSITLRETAHNEGNVDFDTSTHIILKSAFSDDPIEEIDTTPHIILPHTSRHMEYTLQNLPFGFYHVTRTSTIFGIFTEDTDLILVLPIPYLITFLLILIALTILIIRTIKRSRQKHRPTSTTTPPPPPQ